MNLKKSIFALSIGLITLTACEKDDPIIPNEEELITTVTYTLTPVDDGEVVVLKYEDLDGDGGDEPVVVNGSLAINTVYSGEVSVTNELEGEDITEEVADEALEHQFFFTTPTGVTVEYADSDDNNNPIGIATTLTTTNDFTGGNLSIVLRHEPSKSAEGVSDGDITNAGGETDVEVTFNIDVQN